MAERRPLVLIDGVPRGLPSGDTLPEDPTLLKDADKQTAISDFTPGRIAVVDYIPRPTIDQIAGIAPTLDLDFERQVYRHYSPATGLREKALSDIVTFTRASSAQYWDAKGVMQMAGNNGPRIDFDPVTGECWGLLIEEARTNVFLNSLLDGTNLSTQTVTVTAAPWTISFYGTGSITLSGAYSATITGTSDTVRTALTFTPTAGSLTCTVSGTAKWGQCELGGFATSFIPTEAATATRAADVAMISGTAFSDFYVNAGCVMYAETRDSTQGWIASLDINASNRIGFYTSGAFVRIGGVSYTLAGTSSSQVAAKIESGNLTAVLGAQPVLSRSLPGTISPSQLAFGHYSLGNSSYLNACISRFAFFSKALPDVTLQQLTAG